MVVVENWAYGEEQMTTVALPSARRVRAALGCGRPLIVLQDLQRVCTAGLRFDDEVGVVVRMGGRRR